MDRLRAIEYFIKVAELQSFTAAAKAIGVPASSVSRRIQDLEAELGTTLLHRTTRNVTLTERGHLYLEHVRPALKAFEQASELVMESSAAPSGLLRITANPGYGRLLLMPAIQKLRAAYSGLVIDIELTDQVYNLANHEVDIAVRATAELPERAIARKLADSRSQLVASPAYLATFGVPQTLDELKMHRTLLYRGPDRIVYWQGKTAAGWSEVQTQPVFISNIGRDLVDEALNGAGFGLFPLWGIQSELDSGALVAITLDGAELALSRNPDPGIYLLYNQPKYRLTKIKTAVDFLVRELT